MKNNEIVVEHFAGLDNKHNPTSLVNLSRKVGFLSKADNVDVTDDLSVRRRAGYSSVAAGYFHSLWSGSERTFVIKDDVLVEIDRDSMTFTPLLAGVFGNEPVSFVEVDQRIYASDGSYIVRIDEAVTLLTRAGSYAPVDRLLGNVRSIERSDAPVPGSPLVYMYGRLWSVTAEAIFYSLPYEPERFDLTDGFIDLPAVTLLAEVEGGYFIGTDKEVFFVAGGNPNQPQQVDRRCDYGAVAGSCITVDLSQFGSGDNKMSGRGILFESKRGKVLGMAGGRIKELTNERVAYAEASRGAILLREENGETHAVSSLNNKNNDGANFRTTDFAEAEVIRRS